MDRETAWRWAGCFLFAGFVVLDALWLAAGDTHSFVGIPRVLHLVAELAIALRLRPA